MNDALDPLDPLALPLRGSSLIEASAGTGKTWTIAALYLRLVLGHGTSTTAFVQPLPPARILVMTFTIAATRELSERIRERLVAAARCFRGEQVVPDDDGLLAALMASYPAGPARAHAAWRLATAAEAMDDAAVVTIDAWVQRVLREHAFDSGSVFDERLEPDQDAMLVDAAHDYWRQSVYPLTGDALDDVVDIWADPRSLVADVRSLLLRTPDTIDERSLAQARDDAIAACRRELGPFKDLWGAHFETMRHWLVEQLALGNRGPFLPAKLRVKKVDEWLGKLIDWARNADSVALPHVGIAFTRLAPDGLRECMVPGSSLVFPAAFDAFARFEPPAAIDDIPAAMRLHAAARIKQRVRALKHEAGIFGFQDQLERLDRALAGTSGERLRQRIVAQYPVALIDEFQDTSPLQYRIFDRLYRLATNDPSTALLLIGDPKQSIYAFRDADIHSYLRARDATEGRHHRLTTNYRATTDLVDAVNRLFVEAETYADGAFRFGDGSERPVPFVPVAARGRPAVLVRRDGPVPALTIRHAANLATRPDVLRHFAECCAEDVATTLADPRAGFAPTHGPFRRLRPADIAILVRDRHEAAAVRRALTRRRITSAFLSDQESVFESDEAADLLPWLRAVAEPYDARRARVAFATRLIGLPRVEMRALATDDRLFESRMSMLQALHVAWRQQGVLPMLRRTLDVLALPARWLLESGGERRLTNVLHLAELLQEASAGLVGDQALIRWLGDRLADVRKRSDDEVVRLESDAELVRVVTVHKAKGLEYPVVYLPFAASTRGRSKPDVAWLADEAGQRRLIFRIDADVQRRVEREAQQEELRLLYVASTRAQHALWLGVASPGSDHGGFERSALGYLLTGGQAVAEEGIARVLAARFHDMPAVSIGSTDDPIAVTTWADDAVAPPLIAGPVYAASFERDWSIGSFSSLVRGLPRAMLSASVVEPAVEEELAEDVDDDLDPVVSSDAARHRFPRGAFAGNFLHGQLEWLAERRFALRDADVRTQLAARALREGWGSRADDTVAWLSDVVTTPLPPIGIALESATSVMPEMEFWFPSERLDAQRIDALCTTHLLIGRPRPALPPRALRGMLMGFIDLVVEVDGRYWVLDYKSNALGADDRDYTADVLEGAMAAHRYDVQASIYLLALHRLLRQRLGSGYEPARQLGGALYLFMRGILSPSAGCHVVAPDPVFLDALDRAFREDEVSA